RRVPVYLERNASYFKLANLRPTLTLCNTNIRRLPMISDIQPAPASRHLGADDLATGLEEIRRSPKNAGTVQMIVARPQAEQRCILERAELSPQQGLTGDRWR